MEELDGYEQIKELGWQQIHEDTHIPKNHTKGLVSASFENMNKIQFIGFISILEREYSLNLDTLKAKGLEYFEDNKQEYTIAKKVFVNKTRKSFTKYYILIVLVIGAVIFLSNTNTSQNVQTTNIAIDNTSINTATKEIAPKIEQVMLNEEVRKEKARLAATFKILPKSLLWVGYIDLNTGKKKQKTFDDELSLDPHGHWLLTFGHGNVDFDLSGKLVQFKTSRNLRFEYKDLKLRKILKAEFTSLNRGQPW